ncbi:hypothetical protein BDZ45DRAFT_670208 [Acephala macrosclerotiorum]|nr:hypothetical protein BDZ45DRAFT_670208 [Acephala macrosclerotiorum]
MNWTGGRLQRHSTAVDSIKHRQKQHFARVQQTLRSAPKFKSPAKWSVFDLIAEDREQTQQESSDIQLPAKTSSREKSRSISKRPANLLPPAHATGKREQNRIKPSPVLDDDVYNATPPPWKYKQERENSVPLLEMENLAEPQEEEESMSEKRRRILRRGDWVGVGMQKPLHVAFASPRDEENIGKRRKILHGHRARYEIRQTHITSPFPPRVRCPPHVAPSEWARQQQAAAGRADVRISIGGRIVPPGLSSSSARTATRHRSQATPSDVMLLDNEDVFEAEERQTPTNAVQHYSPFSGSQNHSTHRPSGLSQVHSQSEDIDEEPGGGQEPENYQIFKGWAGFSPIPNDETLEDGQDRGNPNAEELGNTDQSSLSNQEAAPTRGLYNSPLPQQVVFSSSSSIYHPKPKSSRVSVLIRSESPEEARSTVAEVGKTNPAVPSSQALDNEAWESWIGPLLQEQGSEDRSNFGDTRHHKEGDISPGVSAVPSRRPFEVNTSSQREEISEPESPEAPDYSQQTSSEGQQTSSEQLESPPSRWTSREVEEDTQRSRPPQTSEAESATDFQPDIYTSPGQSPRAIGKPTAAVSKEEDEDEVWRKFVFGSSSSGIEELEQSMKTPAYDEAGDRREASSSMLAHPATRQSIGPSWKTRPSSGQTVRDPTNATTAELSHAQDFKYPRRAPPPRTRLKPETGRSETTRRDLHNLYTGSFRPNSRAKRIPASVAANSSSSSAISTPPEMSKNHHTQKKTLFTKLKPFVGRKSMESSSEEEPLHIGRNLLDDESTNGYERSRRLEHDVNSFGTSNDRHELETIEDD